VASVAELKAAIEAALTQVTTAQVAVRGAAEALTEAQQSLAAALEGSGHDAVSAAQAALTQAAQELDDCLSATVQVVEQAQTYAATL